MEDEDVAGMSGYKAPAVQKAFRLLRIVAESREELGVTELARNLGMGKSTTHGLTHALLWEGALVQNPRKKFSLGPTMMELAFRNWNYFKLSEKTKTALEELRDHIGETVFLGVLSHSVAIIIARAEAPNPLKLSAPPGTSVPLMAGAVGKVFLARFDDEYASKIIRRQGLPRFTARSVVSEKEYLAELARVREQKYALDDEEYLPGVKAIAMSLGNYRGLPLAIWVVGFAGSMGPEALPRIIKETMETTIKLRTALDGEI